MKKHKPDYRGRGFEPLLESVRQFAASPEGPRLKGNATATGSLLGDEPGNRQVAAWFLGPRAENADLFERLIVEALRDHAFWRRNFHPTDPPAISEGMKRDKGYLDSIDTMNSELHRLLASLKKSAPFFSARYQGHMIWDQTLPGMIGYFAGMMYNQNNVALEASPVTTLLEVEVSKDLCTMLGYAPSGSAWGHLTCGGSTANIEALWAARNLKFYPLTLRHALREDPQLAPAAELTVTLPSGESGGKLTKLDTWSTLNLGIDETLSLSARIEEEFGVAPDVVTAATSPYSLQNMGFTGFVRQFLDGIPEPAILVPGSKHYSLTKGAAILGIGADHMYCAPLDVDGRVDVGWMREKIDTFVVEKRPVITVVGILGTTEEGNVDDIAALLDLRDSRYRPQNVEFTVHADAAWGGYFATLLRIDPEDSAEARAGADIDGPAPVLPMSTYTTRQYENLHRADTITVDPHKTGYLPYPAGAMCYRNGAMRSLISFEAPYINTGDSGPVIGSYGIEGSKPGAAAAGVYLSHAVIRPTQAGYGKILGRTLYNTKMFHLRLLAMNDPAKAFTVVPVPRLNLVGALADCANEDEIMERLHGHTQDKTHAEILASGEAMKCLREIGADLNILTYAFNFKTDGVLNQDLEAANAFNKNVYQYLGVHADGRQIQDYRVIVSTTDFKKLTYGPAFFNNYKRRLLALDQEQNDPSEDGITVMRSVIMDPWLSEDADGKPFMDTVIKELRKVLEQVTDEMVSG
jgi:glutamate/tyrosine decarboxylase-like PLP-dependent enzyme